LGYTLKDGEVAIILKPVYEDGVWIGELSTGMVLSDHQEELPIRHCLNIALTMASAPMFLEDFPDAEEDFEYYRHTLLKEMFPDQYKEAEKELAESKEYDKKGNVLTLKAWTKTEGNA